MWTHELEATFNTYSQLISVCLNGISMDANKCIYTDFHKHVSHYRRAGIRSCFAVTESGKRLW